MAQDAQLKDIHTKVIRKRRLDIEVAGLQTRQLELK